MAAPLNKLPLEIMNEVLCHVLALERRSLSHFSRTCSHYYNLGTPLLYENLTLHSYSEMGLFILAYDWQSPLRFKVSQKLGSLRTVFQPGQRSRTRLFPPLFVKHLFVIPTPSLRPKNYFGDRNTVRRALAAVRRTCPNLQTWCLYSFGGPTHTIQLINQINCPKLMLVTEIPCHKYFLNLHERLKAPPSKSITHLFIPNLTGSYRSSPGDIANAFPNLTHLALSCRGHCGEFQAPQIAQTMVALLALPWPLCRLVLYVLHRQDEDLQETELWKELAGCVHDPRLIVVETVGTPARDTASEEQCGLPHHQWMMFAREGDEFW